jgi:hypothetical protein
MPVWGENGGWLNVGMANGKMANCRRTERKSSHLAKVLNSNGIFSEVNGIKKDRAAREVRPGGPA